MRHFRLLALLACSMFTLAACNADLGTGARPGATPSPFDPGPDDTNGGGGGGGGGGNGGIACPPGTHLDGKTCVADELTCAAEFPCPTGQQCVGGRCIGANGPCATNDDCPTGDICVNGNCQPVCPNNNPQCQKDSDCGRNAFCVACACVDAQQCQRPTPDVGGAPWTVNQDLHLDEALGSFGQGFAGIIKDLRDGALGCPPGSSSKCWIFSIIAGILPNYARTLIIAIGNFADVLDNHDFLIKSQMTFKKNGKPSSYDGTDHWLMLTFTYQNHQIMKRPEDVEQIGQPVILNFQASAVCGVLYVDKHKVTGVLSGLLKWIINTVIEIETCQGGGPCFQTLGDALNGAIDCQQFILNLPVFAACQAFTGGLGQKINDLLDQWLIDYALMTLKGTAQIDTVGKVLSNGHWDGTLGNGGTIFKNFTGEWSGKR